MPATRTPTGTVTGADADVVVAGVVVLVPASVVADVVVVTVVPVSAITAAENVPAAANPSRKRPTASARFTASPV